MGCASLPSRYSGVRRKLSDKNAYVPPALRRLTSGASSDAAQPEKKDIKEVQPQQAVSPAVPTTDKPELKKARGGKVVEAEVKPGQASPVPVLNVTAADGEVQKKEGRTPEKLRTVSLRCGVRSRFPSDMEFGSRRRVPHEGLKRSRVISKGSSSMKRKRS